MTLAQSVAKYIIMKNQQLAFTLIELLVTIAVASIIMVVAVPNMRSTINSNRITTKTNEFVSTLNYARSEAITRSGTQIVIQPVDSDGNVLESPPADNQWGQGWRVWVDENRSNTVDDEEIVRIFQFTDSIKLKQLSGSVPISYLTRGRINGRATFTVCADNHPLGRTLEISWIGRVSLTERHYNCQT